jgi:hypothetical protein
MHSLSTLYDLMRAVAMAGGACVRRETGRAYVRRGQERVKEAVAGVSRERGEGKVRGACV